MLFGPGVKAVTTAKVVKDKMLVNSKIYTFKRRNFLSVYIKSLGERFRGIARNRLLTLMVNPLLYTVFFAHI